MAIVTGRADELIQALISGPPSGQLNGEQTRSLAELLPAAELIVLDGIGHVPTMTRRRFPDAH